MTDSPIDADRLALADDLEALNHLADSMGFGRTHDMLRRVHKSLSALRATRRDEPVGPLLALLERFADHFGVGAHPSMTWKRSLCDSGIEMVHHDGDTIFFGDPNHQDPPDRERFDLIVELANAVPAIANALAHPAASQGEAREWRHKKRGSTYTEVARGELQAEPWAGLCEGDRMIAYRGQDGRVWFRREEEFEDGRFEALTSPATSRPAAQPGVREALESANGFGCVKPDTDRQVFFYEQDFYVLSNFSAFSINWRGIRFPTTEQAYHWERFWDVGRAKGPTVMCQIHREFIEHTISAHEAFKYAQKNKVHQRSDWDDIKVHVMRDILRQKVREHEYVRRKLLQTGDRELIEDSWRDDFWGWGPNRNGQNMLGKLWMEIRAELRSAPASANEVKP